MDGYSHEKRSFHRSISPPAKRSKQPVDLPRSKASTEASTPWTRTPLDPSLSAIRILHLRKGAGDSPIDVKLQVVTLDDRPYYEVLSYVWGNQSVTKRISVDGASFQATVNLLGFLHSLQEKSHQIELMTRIYRQANAAHVWFGTFDSRQFHTDLDRDALYTSLPSMTPEKWKSYEEEGSTSLDYWLKQEGFKCLSQREVERFATKCRTDIFRHTLEILDKMAKGDHLYTYPVVTPWWSRVWTLQEATLPRADPIVHAPPYSFHLSQLLDAVEMMWQHNDDICCKWFGNPVITSDRDDGAFGAAYTQCRAVHAQRKSLAEAVEDGQGVPLVLVTNATQRRTATEVHDHWFGVFGLLPERWQSQSEMFPRPKTPSELFSQYSSLLYLQSADRTLLSKARCHRRSTVDGLPSWAIDLSRSRKRSEGDGDRWDLYNACGPTTHDPRIEWPKLRDPVLAVRALQVSSVQACAEGLLSLSNTPEDLRCLVNDWLTLYRKLANQFDRDTFWRACFMDRNVQTHWLSRRRGPLNAARLQEIKDWWTAWNETHNHHDLTFDRRAGSIKRGRFHHKELRMNAEQTRSFVTSQGLPNMGPRDMRSGDDIYALAGCKALVVLRPISEEYRRGPTVVGLCFVDRWMYGRALQGKAVWRTMNLY
ncbi:hypothetical protein E8E11_009180 [Didymella keratinophila]|nr:hypothetical protein E8E11_009180 [Didymella keratinophila]